MDLAKAKCARGSRSWRCSPRRPPPARRRTFEQPPAFSPDVSLGASAQGANYSVMSPVSSDGLLRHYTVRTTCGDFEVDGRPADGGADPGAQRPPGARRDQHAAASSAQAVAKAGLGPVVFAGNLIAHPVDTTQNTVAGVGQFFDGISSGFNNMGKSRDDTVASLTGEDQEKRLHRGRSRRRPLYRLQAAGRTGSTSSPGPPRSAIWRCRAR